MGLEKPYTNILTSGVVTASDSKNLAIDLSQKENCFIMLSESVATLNTYDVLFLVWINGNVRVGYYSGTGVNVSNETLTTASDTGFNIESSSSYNFRTDVKYRYESY